MATVEARTDSDRLTAIEATIPHLATKADIERMQSSLIKWVIGTWLATLTILVAMLTPLFVYILSHLPA